MKEEMAKNDHSEVKEAMTKLIEELAPAMEGKRIADKAFQEAEADLNKNRESLIKARNTTNHMVDVYTRAEQDLHHEQSVMKGMEAGLNRPVHCHCSGHGTC